MKLFSGSAFRKVKKVFSPIKNPFKRRERQEATQNLQILVVGDTKVGKSTIVNNFVAEAGDDFHTRRDHQNPHMPLCFKICK